MIQADLVAYGWAICPPDDPVEYAECERMLKSLEEQNQKYLRKLTDLALGLTMPLADLEKEVGLSIGTLPNQTGAPASA